MLRTDQEEERNVFVRPLVCIAKVLVVSEICGHVSNLTPLMEYYPPLAIPLSQYHSHFPLCFNTLSNANGSTKVGSKIRSKSRLNLKLKHHLKQSLPPNFSTLGSTFHWLFHNTSGFKLVYRRRKLRLSAGQRTHRGQVLHKRTTSREPVLEVDNFDKSGTDVSVKEVEKQKVFAFVNSMDIVGKEGRYMVASRLCEDSLAILETGGDEFEILELELGPKPSSQDFDEIVEEILKGAGMGE